MEGGWGGGQKKKTKKNLADFEKMSGKDKSQEKLVKQLCQIKE